MPVRMTSVRGSTGRVSDGPRPGSSRTDTTNVAPRGGRGSPAGRRRPPDPAGGRHVRRARRRRARRRSRVLGVAPPGPHGARRWPVAATATRRCRARRRSSCSTSGRSCTTTSSTARRSGATRRPCTSRWALPVALWTADALYAEALHLADGGLARRRVCALGGALRRIADSQVLEAIGATTARYWDVVDGKTVSLFEAAFDAGRRGRRRIAARLAARRGAPVRTAVPVRRRPPGHRR